MLDEIVNGVLVNVITAASRWIATGSVSVRGINREAVEIATWLDTYKLTDSVPELRELLKDATTENDLGNALGADEVQAVVHELLAARLTDAPELSINRIRDTFNSALSTAVRGDGALGPADAIFEYYDNEICTLVGRFEGLMFAALPQVRSEAYFARIIAVLNNIEKLATTLADRVDPDQETRFIASYRNHVTERFGKIQPPDFERRTRIAINEIYVKPNFVEVPEIDYVKGGIKNSSTGEPSPVLSFEGFAARIDRTVILGDPGGGKSTASGVIMNLSAKVESDHIPFIVVLRQYANQGSPTQSVVKHIEEKIETLYQIIPPEGLIHQLFLSGSAIVVFDGLDELLDPAQRLEITEIVEQFCLEYPLIKALVTSRIVGYDLARLDESQFSCYRLSEFSKNQVVEYVDKWFKRDETLSYKEASNWTRNFMAESAPVPDLRSNPLMLALMCILYHGEGFIPRNRPEVYQQCANLLLRKWDMRRQINVQLRSRVLVEPALQHLANWLFTLPTSDSAVIERDLIDEARRFFLERGADSLDEAQESAEELVAFCRGRAWIFSDSGSTPAGQSLYGFTHRTFLEYFAAAFIATSNDTPEDVAEAVIGHVAQEEWQVVAELAIQKKDQASRLGAERALKWMLEQCAGYELKEKSNVLAFMGRCLRSISAIPPRLIRDVTREAIRHALSGDMSRESYYKPITPLISASEEIRQVFTQEMDSVIDSALKESSTRDNAVRLALFVSAGVHEYQLGSYSEPILDVANYWDEYSLTFCQSHLGIVKELAQEDVPFTLYLIYRGFASIEQAVSLNRLGLAVLLTGAHVGVFRSLYVATLPESLGEMFDAQGNEITGLPKNIILDSYAVMDRMGPLPWLERVIDNDDDAPVFFSAVKTLAEVSCSPEDRIAISSVTAVIGCIYYESSIEDVRDSLCAFMPPLEPYIKWRSGERDRSLPPLNISEQLQQTLNRWARGEVSFCRRNRS